MLRSGCSRSVVRCNKIAIPAITPTCVQTNNNNNNNNPPNMTNLLRENTEFFKFGDLKRNTMSSSLLSSTQHPNSFIETTIPILFNSNRSCSTTTTTSDQEQASAVTKSNERISDELYFNDEVINHVISQVTDEKNVFWKDVFNELDRVLSGADDNKIARRDVASRYDNISKELNSGSEFHSELAKKIYDWCLVAPLQAALKKYAQFASQKSFIIAEGNYSLLFGTIYLLSSLASSPRVRFKDIYRDKVWKLSSYGCLQFLGDFIALKQWPKFFDEQEALITPLLESTLWKVEYVEAQRFNDLPEVVHLITLAHNKTRNSLRQQCDFTKDSHAYFACSEKGRDLCARRFVDPMTRFGVKNLLAVTSGFDYFTSDVINIVTGPTGSGKTISSLIAGATEWIPVYNILLHTKIDCIENDLHQRGKPDRAQALEILMNGILKVLESSGQPLPVFDASAPFQSTGFSPSLKRNNLILRIVVDDIGTHPEFLRALNEAWFHWSDQITKWLGVEQRDILQLVAIGTGLDNFHLPRCGSMAPTFVVMIIGPRQDFLKELLQRQLKRMDETKERPPAERLYEMLFGEKALPDSDVLEPVFPRCDDPVFDALRRLATNARCAAIVLSLIYQTFVTNVNNALEQNPTADVASVWTQAQLRASAAYWCDATVAIFCSKCGLATMSAGERHYTLAKAISYTLNRSLLMDGSDDDSRAGNWNRYGIELGLLADTSFEQRGPNYPDFSVRYKKRKHVGKNASPEESPRDRSFFTVYSKTGRVTCAIREDMARFQIDDSFVTMYRMMSEPFTARSTSEYRPFDEAVFDYQRLAAQVGHRHPVSDAQIPRTTAIVDEKSKNASTIDTSAFVVFPDVVEDPLLIPIEPEYDGFTFPHLLYGLGCNIAHSATLNYKLDETALEDGVIPEVVQLSARIWHEKVLQGHALVIRNGTGTIVLAQNRIILTQCNHEDKMETDAIHNEIFNMRGKKLLNLLCWCVAAHSNLKVEVIYVITVGDKKNINEDFPNKTMDERCAFFESSSVCANNSEDNHWPMMPAALGYTTLESRIKSDDTSIYFERTSECVYQLHESIHFTCAFDDDPVKTPSYAPFLTSKMSSPNTASDLYTTVTRTLESKKDPEGKMEKSFCPASKMLPKKSNKNKNKNKN